jgi:tetratricopeptide (TPR) repeat protein
VTIASKLTLVAAAYDPDWIEDLRAVSFAHLGNALRVMDDLRGAGGAFDTAREHLGLGTGYPSVEGEVLALAALLRRDQGRLDDAVALLDRVVAICAETDAAGQRADPDAIDLHRAGAALVQKAWCWFHLGRPEAVPTLLAAAEPAVGRKGELALALRCGRVWCAICLGAVDEAWRALVTAVELAEVSGDQASRLRLRLAEARLESMAGALGSAESILRDTVEDLDRRELHQDAALARCELAAILVRRGEGQAASNLAIEVAELLRPGKGGRLSRRRGACPDLAAVQRLAQAIERSRRPSVAWWSGWGTVLGAGAGCAAPPDGTPGVHP